MTSFEDDVAARIVSQSLGVLGTSLFVNSKAKLQDGDGPFITVTGSGGGPTVEVHTRVGNPYTQPSCQVRVRAKSAPVAKAKARAILAAFVGVRNLQIGASSFYLWIRPAQSEPFDFGAEEVGMANFGFNLNAFKANS